MLITLKDTILDFYYILTATWTVSNMYAQVARVQLCATHQVLITCNMLYAAWYKGTAQRLDLTEIKSHLL